MPLTTSARPPRRTALPAHVRLVIVTSVIAFATWGCGAAVSTFGGDIAAPARAEVFFDALATRFGVAYRDPRFEAIRPKMVRHALTPSRLYPDSSVWTATDGGVRTVSVAGTLVGDRYILAARAVVPPPSSPGDSRHTMNLRRIADAVHRWDSTDELAVGRVAPAAVVNLPAALLAGAERPVAQLRQEYRTAFPRTTAMLSRLFVLDTLQTTPNADESTSITLVSRIDPDRMRPFAPHYADYIEEYLEPLRIGIDLVDRHGSSWGSVQFEENVLRVRLRSHGGVLQPLAGGTGARPDSLLLRGSFFAKVLFFDVGATNIVGRINPVHEAAARGWSLRFATEPRWHFPLAVSRLLRAPLRRPFADDGIRLEFIASETSNGQTVLARNIGIVVQESAIVRWIGRLGATAMGDLSVLAEQEKDRFVGDVFLALADDSRAYLTR